MLYKLIDEYTVIPCPENGVSQGEAITNLPLFYAKNPQRAVEDGFKPLNILTFAREVAKDEELLTSYAEDETSIYTVYSVVPKGEE